MTTLTTLPAPAPTDAGTPPTAHAVCTVCYPRRDERAVALCGHVCHRLVTEPDPPLCVVCVDLLPEPCPVCGTPL